MTWVGGSIIIHGLNEFGFTWLEHVVEAAAHWAAALLPGIAAVAAWIATAGVDFVFGLAFGALMIPLAGYVFAPAWRVVKRMMPRRAAVP
jgi:predicted DNA repair protein MutK